MYFSTREAKRMKSFYHYLLDNHTTKHGLP
jgi:hypothetical protein